MNLSVAGLKLAFPGGRQALAGVTLSIAQGERVAVIGPSGAGKTSLLRVLGTALRPSAGTVAIDGGDPWSLSPAGLRGLRARIGTVYQAPPLPPRQRVVTAVLAGRLGQWSMWKGLRSLVYPADIAGAVDVLARLELSERLFDRCDSLSGGQLQRVGVARVIYQRPDLILADEPVSSLDPQLAELTVSRLNDDALSRDVTLIASLHSVGLALKWFPRVVGLRAGEIQFDCPPDKVSDAMLRQLYGAEPIDAPSAGAPDSRHTPTTTQPLCR